MMLSTRITQTYGLSAPIISAGMACVAHPPLAAAVSNAGGMGTFSAAMVEPEGLRAMIRQTRSLTNQPFGIDFVTDLTPEAQIEVCVAEQIPVAIFFWSLPPQEWVNRLQASGTKVWMEVGLIEEAKQAKTMGFDAIVVQGKEGGGHNRSEASTFSLLPAIRDIVAPIPVIAAGGIIDGKSMVAALALGAEAVWCGTRFLASVEANAHDEYKARVLKANVGDTMRTTLFGPEWPGQMMRVLRNRVVNHWGDQVAHALASTDQQASIGSTIVNGQSVPLPKFSIILPTPDTSGDFEEMCLTAGESSGNIHSLKPAGEIVQTMVAEAVEVVRSQLSPMIIQAIDPVVDAVSGARGQESKGASSVATAN